MKIDEGMFTVLRIFTVWRYRFLSDTGNALRGKPKNDNALKGEQIKRREQKAGGWAEKIDTLISEETGRLHPFEIHLPTPGLSNYSGMRA